MIDGVRRPLTGMAAAAAIALLAPAAAAEPAAPAGSPAQPAETAPRREGFAVGVGLGPAGYRGLGELGGNNGVGGGFSLHVGTAASANLLWRLELSGGGYLIEKSLTQETTYNDHGVLALGAQLYIREAMWLKGLFGVATFRQRASQDTSMPESRRRGLSLVTGGGLDLLRRGIFVLDVEAELASSFYEGGAMVHGSVMLGANWY